MGGSRCLRLQGVPDFDVTEHCETKLDSPANWPQWPDWMPDWVPQIPEPPIYVVTCTVTGTVKVTFTCECLPDRNYWQLFWDEIWS